MPREFAVEASRTTGATPAAVFDYVADLRNLPRWIGERTETVSHEVHLPRGAWDAEPELDFALVVIGPTRGAEGQRAAMRCTAVEWPRRLRLERWPPDELGDITGIVAHEVTIAAGAGATTVTLRQETRLPGRAGRLMGKLLSSDEERWQSFADKTVARIVTAVDGDG